MRNLLYLIIILGIISCGENANQQEETNNTDPIATPTEQKTDKSEEDSVLTDRKSVVQGKSVDLGGRRIIKKKKKKEERKKERYTQQELQ